MCPSMVWGAQSVVIVAHYYPNRELRIEKKSVPVQRRSPRRSSTNVLPVGVSCRALPLHLALNEKTQSIPILEFPKKASNVVPVGFGRLPGSRHIGLPGHRKVLRSVAALEQWAREQQECECKVGMFTATLPGSTKEAMEALSCWSAYLMHEFRTRVRQWFVYRGFPCLWCSVWEWQRRGALHLHVAIALPSDLIEQFEAYSKKIWIRLLENVTEKSGVDLFGRSYGGTWRTQELPHCCNLTVVESSAAGYLAKYLSKSVSKRYGTMAFFCPSRWWGSSRFVKHELRDRTQCVVVSGDDRVDADLLQQLVDEISPVAIKHYSYKPKYRIGLTEVFYVEPEVSSWIMSWLSSVRDSAVSLLANVIQVFLSRPYDFSVEFDVRGRRVVVQS